MLHTRRFVGRLPVYAPEVLALRCYFRVLCNGFLFFSILTMSSRTLDEMQQSRRAIRDSLAQTRSALHRMKRTAAVRSKQWDLPEFVQRVSLAAFVLAGYRADAAVRYLKVCGRERHWPDRDRGELAILVEDLFLRADPDALASLVDIHSPPDHRALALAFKWVHEWRVVHWATQLNDERGVAPSSVSLLQRASQCALNVPPNLRPCVPADVGRSRAKRWAARLRKRWGGRYASIPAGEHLSREEMHSKVSGRWVCWGCV